MDLFESPKIVYPEISKEARFALDLESHYPADTVHVVAKDDWFLLGILNSSSVWSYLTQSVSQIRGGYVRLKPQYLQSVPVPDPSSTERRPVENLAHEAQALHQTRRERVERFQSEIGFLSSQSSSRRPIAEPWTLTSDDFTRRVRNADLKTFDDARDETHSLTERITSIEREIDERVAALYGL